MCSENVYSLEDNIWNDLQLQRENENDVSKSCMLTVFAMIWNCREKMKTMSLKHTLCMPVFETTWNCRHFFENDVFKAYILTYLKRFGTAEKTLKRMFLMHAFWHYLELQRKNNKNDVSKSCILTVFAMIWNCREKIGNINVSLAYILTYLKRFGTAEKRNWKQCL